MNQKWFIVITLITLMFTSGFTFGHAEKSPFNQLSTITTVSGTVNYCGTIGSDQTWNSASNVYVITCDVTVAPGVTLTVNPGVVIKFNSGNSLIVQGALRVMGTSASPVYFTSIKDDTIGGDTNGDGAGSSPNPDDWARIEFEDSSNDTTSLIDHAVIRYGGGYYYESANVGQAGLVLNSASPTIQNTTFSYNYSAAIRAGANSSPKLTNNIYSHNDINGLALNGTISANITWNNTGTVYVIDGGDFAVGVGKTLTVNPGVVVKFNSSRSLIVQGALRVLGTSASRVFFTSIKDDTIGGDTNDDGAGSTPNPGDGGSIQFKDSSNDATSLIDHAVIRYGGIWYGGYAGVVLNSASPTIQNTTFSYNYSAAIRADANSSPKLTKNIYSHNDINGLALNGTISANTTWNNIGTVYVIDGGDFAVGVGKTLTVNPGIVVKINSSRSLIVQGALRVLGTSTSPVYFTSIKDDTIGGDTNNDGAGSTPNPSDWVRIEFEDSSNDSTSLIDHAVIRYGGGYYYESANVGQAGLVLNSASPTIQNSTFSYNYSSAMRANMSSSPTLTNNKYSHNYINGLAINGTISANTTWNNTGTVYVIDSGDVAVGVGKTLTVNPGVRVKINSSRSLIVQGALRVLGTSASPVYFTSIKDDTIGGDTNNDGAGSTPNPSDWARIEFEGSSNDATSLIDHAVIRYGGGYFYESANVGEAGVVLNSASPTIRNSTIKSNNNSGIYINNSRPVLGCNNILSNTTYGIYNTTTSVIVSAKNQWWGSSSGPYNPTTNPSGLGNQVTAGVAFSPWSRTVCGVPGPFNKLAPTNGAKNQLSNLTLKWGASSGTTAYYYCYGTAKPCNNWKNNGTATSKTLSGLKPDTTYYWQVRAVNSLGTTYANASTTDWSFKTAPITGSFQSIGTYNGWVLESSTGSGVGGSLDVAARSLRVGDNASNSRYRSILSLNLGSSTNSFVNKGGTTPSSGCALPRPAIRTVWLITSVSTVAMPAPPLTGRY